jgi:opacity protein-like surface antigen
MVLRKRHFSNLTHYRPFLARTGTNLTSISLLSLSGTLNLRSEVCVMTFLKTLLLAGAVAVPFSGSAQAADIAPDVPSEVETSASGLYVRGDIGWSFLEWSGGSDDNAFVGGGGIGYQYNENFRMDVTADWAGEYEIAPGADISTTTLLGNAYYDFANDSMFTPYIGAGVGYGWVNGSGGAADKDGLALGLTTGVAVDLTNNLAVDVGYRFRDIMTSGSDTMEHQATVGLRVKF